MNLSNLRPICFRHLYIRVKTYAPVFLIGKPTSHWHQKLDSQNQRSFLHEKVANLQQNFDISRSRLLIGQIHHYQASRLATSFGAGFETQMACNHHLRRPRDIYWHMQRKKDPGIHVLSDPQIAPLLSCEQKYGG